MDKKCCIVAAGPSELYITEDSFIIAADAGLKKLNEKGIKADLIIGDFDSGEEPIGENVIKFPVEKDDTDTLLALKEGIKAGYDTFYISGGIGGQLDHTVANLQALAYAVENGVRAYLVGNGQCAFVTDIGACFKAKKEGRFSAFAFGGDAENVKISGLKYESGGVTLKSSFPLGVSNAFIGNESSVTLEKGKLLIIFDGTPDDVK